MHEMGIINNVNIIITNLLFWFSWQQPASLILYQLQIFWTEKYMIIFFNLHVCFDGQSQNTLNIYNLNSFSSEESPSTGATFSILDPPFVHNFPEHMVCLCNYVKLFL